MKLKYVLPILFLFCIILFTGVVNATSTFLYTANSDSNSVSVVDVSTCSVMQTINGIDRPMSIVINSAGTFAYVSKYNGGAVEVISLETNTIVKTITLGGSLTGLEINPEGTILYVADFTNKRIDIVNLLTYDVQYVSTGTYYPGYPSSMCLVGNELYVGCVGQTVVIDVNTRTVTNNIATGSPMATIQDVTTDGAGSVFVTDNEYASIGHIYKISTTTHTITGTLNTPGAYPNGLWGISILNPGYGYICLPNSNMVSKINLQTMTWVANITILKPYACAIYNNDLYVSSGTYTNNITVISTNTNTIISGNITCGNSILAVCVGTLAGSSSLSAQPVYFYVHSYYLMRWENVTLTAYNTNGQLIDSRNTDNNGACTLQLTPGETYTMNAYSSSLGINTTFTYTPPNSYSGSIQQGISVLPFTSWLTGGQAGGITTVQNQTAASSGQNPSGYQDRDIFLNTDTGLVSTTGTINASYSDNSNLTSLVVFDLCTQNTNGSLNNVQSQSFTLAKSGNAVLNPGFDSASYTWVNTMDNYGYWWLIGNTESALITTSTNHSISPPYSLHIYKTGYASGSMVLDTKIAGNSYINVTPGETWGFTLSYMGDGSNLSMGFITRYSNGSTASYDTLVIADNAPGVWKSQTMYKTIPTDAVNIAARISHGGGDCDLYFDNAYLTSDSAKAQFTVNNVDANHKDYIIMATGVNDYYGNVTRVNPASFHVRSLLPGIPEQWHTYLAVIVVVGIFAASVMWLNGIISLAGAGAVYVFYSMGWLDTVPGAALGVGGAVIAAIVFYWNRRETGGLE